MNTEQQEKLEQELTLLANFMGEEIVPYPFSGSRENTTHANKPVWILESPKFTGDTRFKQPCDYHTNWESLMQVVDKIETLYEGNIDVKIRQNKCEITITNQGALAFDVELSIYEAEETKRLSVYKAVVEFVKWFNQNNQLEELNAWYGQQPFDMVEQITGIDIWNACEDDELGNLDDGRISRTQALDEAREVWDKMSLSAKLEWKRNNS